CLLGALKHFLADERRKTDAWKRGGREQIISFHQAEAEQRYELEPADDRTPDKVFDHRWTIVLLETAAARLEQEFHKAGKDRQFQVLKAFRSNEGGATAYTQAGAEMSTTGQTVPLVG